jgi:hypothetical protein
MHVEKKFMKVDYNMLLQNYVHLIQYACWKKIHESWVQYVASKLCSLQICKEITLWVGGAMVKNLIPQCGGEEFKSPHL